MKNFKMVVSLFLIAFFISGCTVIFQRGRRSDIERIKTLEEELARLQDTKDILESRLAQEIANEQVRLKIEDKGLVVTFVAEVLFDSGKAKLKKGSFPILAKVARILKEEVAGYGINIEGHTDNQPIKHSPWKSNWELSSHRALSVLHRLEKEGVRSQRMSATGFGEYNPVASNDTSEGKSLNRRVEIVIVPKSLKKTEKSFSPPHPDEEEIMIEEELK